jgi:toxin ParE1/3/4
VRRGAGSASNGSVDGTVELLKDLPNAGRAGTAEGTREWVVRGMPYIIVYELREEIGELHVLGVFHLRRKRPSVN